MVDHSKLQNFVFRGLLLESTFETLRNLGLGPTEISAGPQQEQPQTTLDDFSLNIRLNAIKMSEIYKAFFCFESSVRELVAQRLQEKHKTSWWTKVPKKSEPRLQAESRKKRKTSGMSNEAETNYRIATLETLQTSSWQIGKISMISSQTKIG